MKKLLLLLLFCGCGISPMVSEKEFCQVTILMHGYPWVKAVYDTIQNDTGFDYRKVSINQGLAWQSNDTTIAVKNHCWLIVGWLINQTKEDKVIKVFITKDTIL
jgi:hypothetical protein